MSIYEDSMPQSPTLPTAVSRCFFSRHILLFFLLLGLTAPGCAGRQKDDPDKYRGDAEEMMSIPYTPRDDGKPLTAAELHAFKTVSDLDRDLSEEDARIVELHFKFFVHQRRGTFERFLERSARFLPYIKKTFAARGIPADIAYLCMVESGGNPNAISPAGAAGLWQFMPYTGRKFGLVQNNWVDERRDPFKATYAASDYLLKLYNDFSNWHLAVAAYNAGEGKIGRAVTGTGAMDFFELCRLDCQLEEKARLRNETRDYVPRLIAVAKIMRNLKRLGFQEPGPGTAWNLSPITVPPGTNLAGLAKELGVSWEEFSGMNPAFRRTASPPASEATAYVPPDKMVQAVNWVASEPSRAYAGWKEYTVKKGDSLASIAKRHKVSVASIREANGFSSLPRRGSVILIPSKSGAVAPVQDARPRAASGARAGGSYTVRAGDTLSALAGQWGVSVADIRQANGMKPKDTALRAGQRLTIPGGGKPASSAPAPAAPAPARSAAASGGSHTVAPGETLFGIAGTRGVSVRALCDANGLDPAKPVIRPGQRLVIPGVSGGAAGSLAAPRTAPAKEAAAPAPRAQEAAAPSKGGTVTVAAGDTLYSIARANKVSVQALQKANKLGKNTKLRIGQKLIIP